MRSIQYCKACGKPIFIHQSWNAPKAIPLDVDKVAYIKLKNGEDVIFDFPDEDEMFERKCFRGQFVGNDEKHDGYGYRCHFDTCIKINVKLLAKDKGWIYTEKELPSQ